MSEIRFYPDYKDTSYYEHIHRYLFARSYVLGRKVLDISSGEGYGSNILREMASEVIGCDIDLETVENANKKYGRSGLQFVQGDCRQMPFDNDSFDVVVSFETIEHIQEQEAFIQEAARVLRKKGIFIVSTPDKRIYTDERNYHNKDHVRELYKEEFVNSLKERFKYVDVYGERFLRSSFIGRLNDPQDLYIGAETRRERNFRSRASSSKGYVAVSSEAQIMPMYIILVCSNQKILKRGKEYSYFFDNGIDEELQRAKQGNDDLKGQLEKAKQGIDDLKEQLQRAKQGNDDLKGQLEKAKQGIDDLKERLQRAEN